MDLNSCCLQLKIDYYKFKIFYKALMVITKLQTYKRYKNVENLKYIITENYQITKEESKRRNIKTQRNYNSQKTIHQIAIMRP